MMDDAIRFEGVSVDLGGINILSAISARVPRGTCTAVVGPNGAGKTTLLRALLGQVPFSGRIVRAAGIGTARFSSSASAQETQQRVGYMPQRLSFDRHLPLTVCEALVSGWTERPLWLGIAAAMRQRAIAALTEVEAESLIDRSLGALSGGELQRVMLAIALGQDPDLLVLDEPAAGVDVLGEQVCCELTHRQRRRRGFTQLMVSHDLALVIAHAEHVICLNRTCIAEGRPRDVLTRDVLRATFGRHLGVADPHDLAEGAIPHPPDCGHHHG